MTSKANLPAVISFDDQQLTIIDQNGSPWLSAADLSRALGYSDADKIGRVYSRHADEFNDAMTAIVETPTSGVSERAASDALGSGAQDNLKRKQRIFSVRGCYAIGMFARTPKAHAFRRWVLDVLEGIATPAQRAPKRLEKQQHDLPPPAFNADLQERIYKRAGVLSGQHYTDCVEQMNRQRHLPPVCFTPETWTPLPHTTEAVADLDTVLSVMDVFGKKLARHRHHLAKQLPEGASR